MNVYNVLLDDCNETKFEDSRMKQGYASCAGLRTHWSSRVLIQDRHRMNGLLKGVVAAETHHQFTLINQKSRTRRLLLNDSWLK